MDSCCIGQLGAKDQVMSGKKQIVLASLSPYRKSVLASSGVPFSVKPAAIDESQIIDPDPKSLALSRAKAKAVSVARDFHSHLIIGCDQVLGFNGQAFDKVTSREQALGRLKLLQGKSHTLHSALCLFESEGSEPRELWAQTFDIEMPMRPLTDLQIEKYLNFDEWQGSVGCYQFENHGVHLFKPLVADTSAIIGLPLLPLLEALRRNGADILS
jgi:septum formation protein